MTTDIRNRIAAVLARYDSPSMRRDLAYWYDVEVADIDRMMLDNRCKTTTSRTLRDPASRGE